MKAFRAADVMKAAQRVYRQREKERDEKRRQTGAAGGTLKGRLSDAVHSVTRPISFSWSADRTIFRLAGYPENIVFFPQHVVVRNPDGPDDEYTFLCHADRETDPNIETPLMYEYQAVLADTQLFHTHAALRDHFENAPDTFRRTLDAGPVILFAKENMFSDDVGSAVEIDEVRLLGTYVALNGGMKSWVGQHYLLSNEGGNVFITYPDVRDYLSRLVQPD